MAFINLENKYIRLLPDGTCEIYASAEARDRIKNSTDGKIILAKYRELLKDLEAQPDFLYYDPEGYAAAHDPLEREYDRYWYNFNNYIVGQEYPLMAAYYPDVADSIPEIVEKCWMPKMGETLDKAYEKAKQIKRFGETRDA